MLRIEMGAKRKILILLPLLLIVSAGAALGQTGYIGVYADPAGTECMLSDRGGREVSVVVRSASVGWGTMVWRMSLPIMSR